MCQFYAYFCFPLCLTVSDGIVFDVGTVAGTQWLENQSV
jgi:hypothetical protein